MYIAINDYSKVSYSICSGYFKINYRSNKYCKSSLKVIRLMTTKGRLINHYNRCHVLQKALASSSVGVFENV